MAVHGTFNYTSLPARATPRVYTHPDVKSEWCMYGPDRYKIPVFVKGIYKSTHMGTVTNLVSQKVEEYLSLFVEPDSQAHLGDGERHEEFGYSFPEPTDEVLAADESLGPLSAPPINIITETDRTIEKWKIRVGWTLHEFVTYFYNYSTFSQFMKLLEGNLTRGINKSLVLILKAVMCADPSQVSFGDKEFARIYGKTYEPSNPSALDSTASDLPSSSPINIPTRSKQGRVWVDMMKKAIEKYWGKSVRRWPNIKYYNPTYYSHDNEIEEMTKGLLYEGEPKEKNKSKRQIQQLYTDAHELENHGSSSDTLKTKLNFKTWRVDSLIALAYTLVHTLDKMTNRVSTEMWLGNDTGKEVYQTASDVKKVQDSIAQQGLDGSVVGGKSAGQVDDGYFSNIGTSSSYNEGFEVMANPEDLVVFLNPEDYAELKIGVARRGQMDVRQVSLAQIQAMCPNVYAMEGIKPGFARIVDKRAFRIKPYFELTDLQTPAERLAFRQVTHFHFSCVMFNLFAGVLLVPSPHFVASPYYYDKYGLIGQAVAKLK